MMMNDCDVELDALKPSVKRAFLSEKTIAIYIYPLRKCYAFACIYSDFSFLLTLSACDTGWANTVVIVAVIVVDVTRGGNNGSTTHNL